MYVFVLTRMCLLHIRGDYAVLLTLSTIPSHQSRRCPRVGLCRIRAHTGSIPPNLHVYGSLLGYVTVHLRALFDKESVVNYPYPPPSTARASAQKRSLTAIYCKRLQTHFPISIPSYCYWLSSSSTRTRFIGISSCQTTIRGTVVGLHCRPYRTRQVNITGHA